MRISVDHRTNYGFTKPQARIVQLLRLTPQDSIDQTVINWHIGVDCDVRLRQARDGYGNSVTMLYAEGPLDDITITVQGEVLTAGENGVVRGSHEPMPPALYCRVTDRTTGFPALEAFVHDVSAATSLLDRMCALNEAIHDRFTLVEAHHDDGLSAADVFGGESGSARDLSHLMIAGARCAGVPARYVSGYHADDGHHPAPHAWAEVYVDGLGWVAFDPSYGVCADTDYVRVAVALDFAGASATAGSRLGPGEERLKVDVQVEALRTEA